MTTRIAAVLLLLILAAALFITERLRVDVVALPVLGALALTGLVTPAEAVSGPGWGWCWFYRSSGRSKRSASILLKQLGRTLVL